MERFASLAHINRKITERKQKLAKHWFKTKHEVRLHKQCLIQPQSGNSEARQGSPIQKGTQSKDLLPVQVVIYGNRDRPQADRQGRQRLVLGVQFSRTNG